MVSRELSSAGKPVRRIRPVVRPLRWLDAVEEALVDDRLPGRRHRRQQRGGPFRVAPRYGRAPEVTPVPPDLGSMLWRDPVQERCLVEERVTDAAVSPVEQD